MEKEPKNKAPEVLIQYLFNAPRALVFQAWTTPALLEKWYAPQGCSIHFAQLEAREKGVFHSCIRTPDGKDCWCIGTYLEFKSPDRLVFTMEVADEHGNPASPVSMGMHPDWPQQTIVTVTFEEQNGGTLVTLHQTVDQELAKFTGAHPSWIQMMDNLQASLKTATHSFFNS